MKAREKELLFGRVLEVEVKRKRKKLTLSRGQAAEKNERKLGLGGREAKCVEHLLGIKNK